MKNLNEKYKLERFETKTGILLNDKNKPYTGEGKPYLLFDSLDEAKNYLGGRLCPGVQYLVSDSAGNIIYENVYDEVIREVIKWWQFWK